MMETNEIKRAWIISDTHFGARNNSVEWLNNMIAYFEDFFIPKVKENYKKGDILIHCGDVYDNRQSVNLLVLHRTISLFEKFREIFDGIYVIAGNHDIMRKNSNDISSLDTLKYIPGVHIFKEPISIKTKYADLLFMPWRKSHEDEVNTIHSYNADYLFCHTTISGVKFDKYRSSESGLKNGECKDFKRVYSGHIHLTQRYKNILYVGNPYQMTRSDTNNNKGFWCIDFESGEETFFENTYSPKFIKIYLEKTLDNTLNEIIDVSTNNFVDVYIPSEWLLKYQITPLIEQLSDVSKRLEVIPFDSDDKMENNEINYEKTLNTYNLCENYVNNMSLEKSIKDRLLKTLKELYNESIK